MAAIPFPDGTFRIVLDGVQRRLLAQVCTELRDELSADPDDGSFRRLYPTAHPDDAEQQQFYDQMTRGELTDRRIAALERVVATVDLDVVDRDDLDQWMVAINAVRLVLGTRLDVCEEDDLGELDPDDPNRLAWQVYEFLGILLARLVYGIRLADR